MTEIKITPKDKIKNASKKVQKILEKVVVLALILGAVTLLLKDKTEALSFAFTNSKQVVQAKESYLEELKKAETKFSENLSRSYIPEN